MFNRESLNKLLERIEQQSDLYTYWNEFQQYFTRKGFPIVGIHFDMINQDYKFREITQIFHYKDGTATGLGNISFQCDSRLMSNRNIVRGSVEGVEMKRNSRKNLSRDKNSQSNIEHQKTQLWKLENYDERKNELKKRYCRDDYEAIYGQGFGAQHRRRGQEWDITVPEEFNFQHRNYHDSIRNNYIKELVDEVDEEKELNYKFKAKAVPKHVKNKNLYGEIVEHNEEKKKLRKAKILEDYEFDRKFKAEWTAAGQFSKSSEQVERVNRDNGYHSYSPPKFKARAVPHYNRLGLYDELVHSKRIEQRTRYDQMRMFNEYKNTDEYYEERDEFWALPKRMADYERERKRVVMERNENAKNEFNEMFTFKPNINVHEDIDDWAQYFNEKQ